jgi:hypothetical protein
MNEVYRTPLFTSWPVPVNFRECFAPKEKASRNKAKNGAKKANRTSFFLNLSSIFY